LERATWILSHRQIVWPSNFLSKGDETLDDYLQPRSINTEGGQ